MALDDAAVLAALKGERSVADVCRAAGVTQGEFAQARAAWLRRHAVIESQTLKAGVGGKVDILRDKAGIPAKVATIEYDPNRGARIALLHYADGEKRYIIAPVGLNVGDQVVSGPEAEPKAGNALPLSAIPLSLPVHNIEMVPGKGAKMVRGAGLAAQIMAPPSVENQRGCEVWKCLWKSSGRSCSWIPAETIRPSMSAGVRPASAIAAATASSAMAFVVRPEGPLTAVSPMPVMATSSRTSSSGRDWPQSGIRARWVRVCRDCLVINACLVLCRADGASGALGPDAQPCSPSACTAWLKGCRQKVYHALLYS